MQYVKLGNSGLDVSKICLGCMGFGNKIASNGTLDTSDDMKTIKYAIELGINFFDTANECSSGQSEESLGIAINKHAVRDEVVIATKVHQEISNSPNRGGLSRKHIFSKVNQSLNNLKSDYIDLLIINRWDYNTPIEETMRALDDLVKSGKVHYLGASSMYAWQFSKAMYVAENHGWTKFITIQNSYNLLYREEEREMMPLCRDLKIAMTPCEPLAQGRLTNDWVENSLNSKDNFIEEPDIEIFEALMQLSKKTKAKINQLALAWLLYKNPVVSPVVNATKKTQLDEVIGALNIPLTEDDIKTLESAYIPHKNIEYL